MAIVVTGSEWFHFVFYVLVSPLFGLVLINFRSNLSGIWALKLLFSRPLAATSPAGRMRRRRSPGGFAWLLKVRAHSVCDRS